MVTEFECDAGSKAIMRREILVLLCQLTNCVGFKNLLIKRKSNGSKKGKPINWLVQPEN